jgi:hypothetical protein
MQRMPNARQTTIGCDKSSGAPTLSRLSCVALWLCLALLCAGNQPAVAADSNSKNAPDSQNIGGQTHSTTAALKNSPAGQRPMLKLGTDQSSFNLGVTESTIAWERWHHKVGKALHKAVEKVTRTSLGEVVMMVTVTRECNLTAEVLSASSQKMGDACVEAAKRLNGDTILIFPPESKRNHVKFKFEYRRGFFLWPHNRYINDDFEKLDDAASAGGSMPSTASSTSPEEEPAATPASTQPAHPPAQTAPAAPESKQKQDSNERANTTGAN